MSPPPRVLPRWGQLFTDAIVCTLLLVFCEGLAVTLLRRAELAGGWEIQRGLRHVVLIAWLITLPIALASATSLRALMSGHRLVRRVMTALALVAGVLVALGVSQGRHFESLPLRFLFCAVVGTMSGVLIWASLPVLRKGVTQQPLWVGLTCALAVIACEVLNARVLPGLYPAFHVALAALSAFLAPGLALLWTQDAQRHETPTRVARLYPLLLLVPLALSPLVPWASRRLASSDNVRFVYGSSGPTLKFAIELAAQIAPPPDSDVVLAASSSTTSPSRALFWGGRDIVLISIDALRADHVGAYGYARPITPNIDRLAASGVRFDAAFCATPHTSYAVTSMMTGKYVRPLLLQGAGADSDTLAGLLRTYGFRTAAFYPPAVFFIDGPRFQAFEKRYLDFEYRKVEFTTQVSQRPDQVEKYLARAAPERRLFLWVHLFEPHEPYDRHDEHALGDRDVDLYDGEIATSDDGVGRIVEIVRAKRPEAIIIVTADHGEEFGEHGGRYHGTSVYDEQVRVPLIMDAPGALTPRVIHEAVQTIDILPTVLSSLGIPRPARVRGNDLGALIAGTEPAPDRPHDAFSETDEMTLLARRSLRLVCLRRAAACQLFDIAKDPLERRDVSAQLPDDLVSMKQSLRAIEGAHGKLEAAGRRAEGKDWPEALRRGLAGDGDATLDVAALLDDADVTFRRRAAEVLFELNRAEAAPALRLAMTRDEDDRVKRWAALALTRLGEGATRVLEMLDDPDVEWRRLAALALAESGDRRGEDVLVAWWSTRQLPFERAVAVAAALGKIRSKAALVPLIRSLDDLRLRPYVARALAKIGEAAARPALLEAFSRERYVPSRLALGTALIDLGAQAEMAPSLARFLGVPDPLEGGVALAIRGKFLQSLGGPDGKDMASLARLRTGTVGLDLVVPRASTGTSTGRTRVIVRGRSRGTEGRPLRIGKVALVPWSRDGKRDTSVTELDRTAMVEIVLPVTPTDVEVAIELPPSVGAAPARGFRLAVERTEDVEISGLVVVPIVDELSAPAPEPWTAPNDASDGEQEP